MTNSILGRPRFPLSELSSISARYQYELEDSVLALAPAVRQRGHLTKHELRTLVEWKSPRPRRFIVKANELLIAEASRTAFTAKSEEVRIGVLTLIPGVAFPMASVILHFFHDDPYPIIDFRALWSLNMAPKSNYYTFALWERYVSACRALAEDAGVDMRTLDRALWQYSKENQPA